MGIFTRFRDIITSNINSMLDKAEDPEKLIKLMIREMEDTLIEIKASCANTIANHKRTLRTLEGINDREEFWETKAQLAVKKNRDDLAREALKEKRRYSQKAESVEIETNELEAIIDQYKDDIQTLENKLKTAGEKQRLLVQRHRRAQGKMRAQEEIRRADSAEVVQKFDELENHIERMEAEAELVNFGKLSPLENEFENLVADDEIEKQLKTLKSSQTVKKNDKTDA
ncbi:MAG: PspA/IM30 family protein [Desulfobacteraceae bacterium]|nr:PspA/IM30 family protein [Desulfobacteraceae bacterium]